MTQELAKDFILLVSYLLPGFLAAWIFYGFTSHPKPSQFERVVQALIFTFIIQTIIPLCKWFLELLGHVVSFRPWDTTSEGLASLFLAVLFGCILAHFTNNDAFHKFLRKKGFTSRTSHPSEWFYVFSEKVTFVILHFHDGWRLYGWPKEWPIEPDKGQFYIMLPSWIQENGQPLELHGLDGTLVSAKDIKWVEFVNK